ncbi:Phosphopantothenoylcysteine decarboxylase [Penicillium diatomitis]|uniref:Large ribosomal subunit protein mL49 n=1 Tax=Penicillium diatomitis TaxID=2819901 RepID=A0A9W9XHK5_9EURO|nr:Phosphopantothenoylcysteine decarboxylase [Penicillium diatomitis]KAJ5493126.1 Phosphopantothenoylcysteine decarboxylase [Penicillium diatomitis]
MASFRQSASVASSNFRLAQSVASVQTCSRFSPVYSFSHLRASYRSSTPQISPPAQQSRGFLTQLRREAQALKEQPISQTAPLPKNGKQLTPNLSLTNLPYFVRRTGSNQLPVYLVTKAGGTKQLTKIQKTEGDLDAFRNDLAISLGIDTRSTDVSVNRLTGHIIVKGWRKPEIVRFLQERNF